MSKLWDALQLLFSPTSNTPRMLRDFFSSAESKVVVVFLHSILSCFQHPLLSLQKSNALLPELMKLIRSLQFAIRGRRNSRFFSAMTEITMRQLEFDKAERLKEEFIKFYDTALEYIDAWFQLTNIQWIMLATRSVQYKEVKKLAEQISPELAEQDSLFDEVSQPSNCYLFLFCRLQPNMPSICSLTSVILSSIIVVLGILFVYFNGSFDPQVYSLKHPPKLAGVLAPNKHLRNANLILKGQISGPESLLVEGNTIYTGTWDAKIVKIVDGVIKQTIKLTNETVCGTFDTEPICGRPLGIRRLNKDLLVVADAYLGIYTLDFAQGKWKQVYSTKQKINGESLSFVNDLDVLDENTVFFTDSSSKWDRRRFLHSFMEAKPNGRVFQLNLNPDGEVKVVMDNLYFANGLQIFPDKQSFLVSECSMSRIKRFYFAGAKKGTQEVFVDNLPGLPDNIRLSYTNTFYVGLAGVRHSDEFSLVDKLGDLPWLRKLLIEIIPERYLAKLFTLVKRKYGIAIELDQAGKIISAPQDPDGLIVTDASQVSDDATHLYLGSFHADFIAKVPKKGL
uniref:Strictosidine synthase conserved region domain-containing protein n=1 Tax=Ditylenchus dipsaci TaxID=166011 RepID=A0A915E1G4_9BILA